MESMGGRRHHGGVDGERGGVMLLLFLLMLRKVKFVESIIKSFKFLRIYIFMVRKQSR